MFVKYLFTKNSSIVTNANIISFSYTELQKEPSVIHTHPHCEIIIPLNTYGYLVHKDQKTQFSPHELYIINPFIPHTEINIERQPKTELVAKYFVVKIDSTILDAQNNKIDYVAISNNKWLHVLKDYLSKAYQHYLDENEVLTILNLSSFYYLFSQLIKETTKYQMANFESQTIQENIILEFEYFVSKNYNLEINIQDFIEQHHISYSSFIKKCKQELGYPPSLYVLKKRVEISKHLLATTDFTIWLIARQCGFISAAYYTMQFKKFEGITPSQYRSETKNVAHN